MKNFLRFVLPVLLVLTLAGCQVSVNRPNQPGSAASPAEIGPKATYFSQADMQKLPAKVKGWYDANYKQAGLHSMTDGEDQYLLISAGEKKLQGSWIDDIRITGQEKQLKVSARLYEPSPEISAVAPGLSYPHVVVKISKDSRELSFNLTEFSKAVLYQINTGRLVRLPSKDNDIQIAISGNPASMAPASFKLGAALAQTIGTSGLAVNDDVRFAYAKNIHDQPMILELDKIGPVAQPQPVRASGTYVGLADNHTVELTVDGKAMALQLTEPIKAQLDGLKLKKGDKVELKYVQNEQKQWVITEITPVK